jgi:SMI1 / KNR4 family (SUKH-1)
MGHDIREQADAILRAHKALGHDLEPLLWPGLPKHEIAALTADIPCQLPQSVIELFAWRNGTRTGLATFGEMWFYPGWHMLSLDEAIKSYQVMMADELGRWHERWFPVFCGPGCDFRAVVCGEAGPSDGAVIDFDNESPEPPNLAFSGVDAMLQCILTAFEDGIYFIDETGMFSVDYRTFADMAKKIDPKKT